MILYDSNKIRLELINIKVDLEEIYGESFYFTEDRSHPNYDIFIVSSFVNNDFFIHFKYDILVLNFRPCIEQVLVVFSIPKIITNIFNLSSFTISGENTKDIENIRLWTVNKLIKLYGES